MRKIHVLTRKEEIDPTKIVDCTAVIIDVLLAPQRLPHFVPWCKGSDSSNGPDGST